MRAGRPRAVPLKRVALALTLGLALAGAAQAQSVDITPDAARAGLRSALAEGRIDHAWHLARGLIAALPQDYAGHAGLAQAELRLGRPAPAREAARAAQARARGPVQRYEAALLLAQAHEAAGGIGAPVLAQYWSRRAYAMAPDGVYRQAAMGEVQRIRRDSRLSLRLDVTAAPSGNVNNGTRASVIDFFGLPMQISPQSRALSGWIGQGALSGRWRLAQGAQSVTHLRFAVVHRAVRLSAAALSSLEQWRQDQLALGTIVVPQTNHDFSAVEFGLGHRRQWGKVTADFGVTLGHNWFAGADLTDYLRLDLAAERPVAARSAVFGTLALERQWRHDSPLRDADQITLQAGVMQGLAGGDRLRFSLGARQVTAGSVDVAHRALMARLAWEKAAPVAGIRVSASLGTERRRHGASLLAPAGRRDLRLSADLSLTFERLDVMGFAPSLDLNASRTRSNHAVQNGRDIGLTLGLKSVF